MYQRALCHAVRELEIKTTRSILVELVSLLRQLHFLMNFIRIDTLHCFYYLDEHLVSCFDVAPFGVDLAIGGEKGRRSWSLRKKGCFIKEISCWFFSFKLSLLCPKLVHFSLNSFNDKYVDVFIFLTIRKW